VDAGVTVWWLGRGTDPALFRRLIADRLEVEIVELGADSQERTIAALADGTAGDILMIPRAGTLARLVREGHFAPLDGYRWTDRVLPPARRLGTYDGHLYALPRSSETMLLFHDRTVFAEHGWRPPRTLADLDELATAMLGRGIVPFAAGCADFPQSVELYFSLIVNHDAGPAAVRAALAGDLPWTADVFEHAVTLLRSWFDRGWFGDRYFTDGWVGGFGRLATGAAGLSPNMTWVFGEIPELFGDRAADVGIAPFPARDGTTLYVYGTGSLIGVNAAAADPDAAAAILERVFTTRVRRDFSRELPGDWNLPLTDPDADGLRAVTTPQFADLSVALTEALGSGRYGYGTWSFFPPRAEEAVIAGFRDMVDGRITVPAYLTAIDDAFRHDRAAGYLVELP
jgi:raffinose/stachyose/melibiose transport system substrate-binding protein